MSNEKKEAVLNGVKGSGYAVIKENHKGIKCCDGTMTTSSEAEALKLMGTTGVSFSGTVYDGSKESRLTFPVVITKIQNSRVSFSATGNPYAKKA